MSLPAAKRAFAWASAIDENRTGLALALAPALTPDGIEDKPRFFRGFAVYPQVLARGLAVLADVTSTRYFKYKPEPQRDPALTAQGDRLRAECFSACNSVYARLDLLGPGLDGEIRRGTTNVDIGPELRAALSRVKRDDKLHVDVGGDGLAVVRISQDAPGVSRIADRAAERPVRMPERWVRALGNAAEMHQRLAPSFTLNTEAARSFLATLPPPTSSGREGWLAKTRSGAKLAARKAAGAVYIHGLHRLSALRRVTTNLEYLTFYAPPDGEPGQVLVEAGLPAARLWFGLTEEAWRGYSGEGSLLEALARPELLEDAADVGALLRFDALIDAGRLSRESGLDAGRVRAALAALAVFGKAGYDARDESWFHRELPEDPERVLKDNPRLAAAQKLISAVKKTGGGTWIVESGGAGYRVHYDPERGAGEARCTCTWYLGHGTGRGPCKHILAVQLAAAGAKAVTEGDKGRWQ
jgi:hypothetical protein